MIPLFHGNITRWVGEDEVKGLISGSIGLAAVAADRVEVWADVSVDQPRSSMATPAPSPIDSKQSPAQLLRGAAARARRLVEKLRERSTMPADEVVGEIVRMVEAIGEAEELIGGGGNEMTGTSGKHRRIITTRPP